MKEFDPNEFDTLPKLLVKCAREAGDKVSMVKKTLGIWKEYTWNDYLTEVKYFALGLEQLGFARGDKLAIVGDNEPEWYWAELAGQSLGGVVVGIFSDAIASEIEYLLRHSGSQFVVASDQEQVDKLLDLKDGLPGIKKVIFWDYQGLDSDDDPILVSWDTLRDLGEKFDREHPGAFDEHVSAGNGDDVCLYMYTSGTSGVQKGAIRTHMSFINAALLWKEEFGIIDDDRRLSFYSPAWILEQVEGVAASLVSGQKCFFPENAGTAMRDMREVGPTMFFTASRIWEGLASTIQIRIIDSSRLKRFVFNTFLPFGQKMSRIALEKRKPPFWLHLLYKVGDFLVFAQLRDRMGLLKVRAGITAGALLSPEAFGYFWAIGIPIRQVYGLTEMAPIAMHTRDDIDENTLGSVPRGVEAKITEEGEVIARGNCMFSGYYDNPEANEEALRDGWFYTGDWGHFDDKGHLLIFDRLKSAVVMKNGSKLAPQYLESRLKFSPYINDAIVIGGGEYDFVSVLINIEFDNVAKWADKRGLNYLTFTDLSQKNDVCDLIREEINKLNDKIPEEMHIRKFINLYLG